MKELLGLLGGIVSVANLLVFSYGIWTKKVPAPSLASWIIWLVLDLMLLVTTILTGNPVWLPLSYVVGAGAAVFAISVRGKWTWSSKETLSSVLVLIATIVWQMGGPTAGIIAGVLAMTMAGVPVLVDLWRKPIPETFWMWEITAIACLLSLLASNWTWAGSTLAGCGMIFNLTVAFIVLRKK